MEDRTKLILNIINTNAYKLYLCNKELQAISDLQNKEDINVYSTNKFLVRSIDAIHINFCILVNILIHEREHNSILKITDKFDDTYLKEEVLKGINSQAFQNSYIKIKTLRNKCYAHNDNDVEKIRKEINLTQHDRNIVCDGIISSVKLMCEKLLDVHLASFDMNKEAEIIKQIRVMKEWKRLLTQETIQKLNKIKR